MKSNEYTGAIYTKASDMYKCYDVLKLLNPAMTQEQFNARMDRITRLTNYEARVVLCGDKVVSVCATSDNMNMSASGPSCKINNLATLHEHRNGVTQFLLHCVEDDFKRQGYDNLNLCCTKGNPAESFYEKNGFEQPSRAWTKKISNEANLRSRL